MSNCLAERMGCSIDVLTVIIDRNVVTATYGPHVVAVVSVEAMVSVTAVDPRGIIICRRGEATRRGGIYKRTGRDVRIIGSAVVAYLNS
jgi:hypothetical protein